MNTLIFESYSEFLGRDDKSLNGVSKEFAEANPDFEKENETNEACWDCRGCSDCRDCSSESEEGKMDIPVIENIHQKVLSAVSVEGALDMTNWHSCETTHCRAGWVEALAGERGKMLAKQTSTLFAAMQIYKASSPIKVSPVRFFDRYNKAMEDMKRCANEELNTK